MRWSVGPAPPTPGAARTGSGGTGKLSLSCHTSCHSCHLHHQGVRGAAGAGHRRGEAGLRGHGRLLTRGRRQPRALLEQRGRDLRPGHLADRALRPGGGELSEVSGHNTMNFIFWFLWKLKICKI